MINPFRLDLVKASSIGMIIYILYESLLNETMPSIPYIIVALIGVIIISYGFTILSGVNENFFIAALTGFISFIAANYLLIFMKIIEPSKEIYGTGLVFAGLVALTYWILERY